MSVEIENARHEWEESHRLLEAEAADHARYEGLLAQVDSVTAELRRRIGQTFTLAQLADEYVRAESWSRDAVEAADPAPDWPRTLAVVEGAAFHVYSRGAIDYEP